MRKLSAKKKVKKVKAQDEDASSGVEDTNVNLEANENGGKNEESSGNESDNSKTVKRKSRKNANKKAVEADEESAHEEEKSEEEKEDDDDANEGEEAEPEYEVKDIVDQKVEKGVTYFLIRWKGYGADDDTWEAEDTLNCADLIAKFKKKSTKEPSKNSTEKSTEKSTKGKRGRKRKADEETAEEEPADPDKEWEVARIINVGYEKGVRLFRIRWKGYGPKNDTWEPEEHLNCTEMIDKFLEGMKRKEQVEQKELREKPKRTERLAGDSYRRGSKRNAGKTRAVYYEGDDE